MDRARIAKGRRWVVKIGSALLTNDGKGLADEAIADWVRQIADLRKRGYEVVLVSSGAVAAGMHRLGWTERPKSLHQLQAAAAVGQTGLVRTYEHALEKYNLKSAQVLLDHDDFSNRQRYLNARSTIKTLCSMGVIPIVNENDTVVTDEIRFGDNDTLGALVANLIEADVLCILTDQDAMYDGDPRKNALAQKLIARPANDSSLDAMAGGGGKFGTGGMSSKVSAARLAARSGADTVIVGGRIDDVIPRVAKGELIGTLLYSEQEPLAARKRWLDGNLQPKGRLVLDNGAVTVLTKEGKSLLPVGVKQVAGEFQRGDLVACFDLNNKKVASGLVNYSADEARKICGLPSAEIARVLGYKDDDELIHRDNLVVKA